MRCRLVGSIGSLTMGQNTSGESSFVRQAHQLFGLLECFWRDPLARKHPSDLAFPGRGIQLLDFRDSPAFDFALTDHEVVIGETGHLGKMRHTQHLVRCRELL